MNEIIAYIGLFEFPYGQAASKRVLGNIKLLNSLGFEVLVGHGGNEKYSELTIDGHKTKCYGLDEIFHKKSGLSKLYNHVFISGNSTIKWLNGLQEKPTYLICYGGYYTYSNKIINYCKKNNIKIIFDLVEWYQPDQMLGGRYGFFYNSFLLAFKYIYPKADGIIAISSALKENFNKNRCVIIPPLDASVSGNKFIDSEVSDCLSLVYAGNIGNKDYLGNIIKVVEKLSLDHNLYFSIYGPTEREVKLRCGIDEIPIAVGIFGKVDQEKINDYIRKSDFTIFVRPNSHCNKYGFPSKFVESLALGVPVATNITSDLNFYLKDGYNGFIISGISEQHIEDCIVKMLELSTIEKLNMRKNSLTSVRENFSCESITLKSNVFKFFYEIADHSDEK